MTRTVTIRQHEYADVRTHLLAIANDAVRSPGALQAVKQLDRALLRTQPFTPEFTVQPSETAEWALHAALNRTRAAV